MFNKLQFILTSSEKKKIITLTLGSLVLALSEMVSIGIFIPIMSLFINPGKIHTSLIMSHIYQYLRFKDSNVFLLFLIVGAIIAFTLRAFLSILMTYFQQSSIGKVNMRLTAHVLESYLEKPYSFHLASNSSKLFKNVSLEVNQFISGFLTPIILISSELIILLGIFLFLIFVFPVATLLLIVIFGIIVCSSYSIFKKRVNSYSVEREKYGGQIYRNALEALHAVKEIKVFNAQPFFIKRFTDAVRRYYDAFIKFSVVSVLPRYLFETVLISAMLLFLLFSVLLHKTFTELMPMMIVFGLAAIRLVPSFSKIYSNSNLFHYSRNSLDIVYDVLRERNLRRAVEPAAGQAFLGPKQNSIQLRDITFAYENTTTPIFERLNIAIPLKKTVAIVGLTGSGKSTLIDIIMGLLIPSSGALSCCGIIVNEDNVSEYRRKIGYVSQNLTLIDDTISSNIAFGIPKDKLDSKELEKAIKIAQLEAFVKELPAGFDTLVGERGVRISGGQKQRIGIARAIYRSPEILILDEATSALDKYTESRLYVSLRRSNPELTIIIVTHRVDTLEHADHIYVIDSGKIVDEGNFKELLEISDIFKKIIQQEDSAGEV